MKNFSTLFLMLLMMALPSSLAFAGRYSSLKFTSGNGYTYTVATDNLEILVSGETITFNNTNLMIPLSSLVSMEFTDYDDSPAAVGSLPDVSGGVTVYDMNGLTVGSFDSYSDALGSLGNGMFVIKDTNGNSLKISVGK